MELIRFLYLGVVTGLCFMGCSSTPMCDLIAAGGFLQRPVTLQKSDSPCFVRNDLIIPERYTLTLNAGVELRFARGVMLAVNGTLLVKGKPDDRVILTKSVWESDGSQVPIWPSDIRLVDDFSVQLGRLQIKYREKWRGICANFQNWTQTDVDVSCQQLGFQTGNFSFVSWATNDTSYMLYHKPSCSGQERNIMDCPGSKSIKIGSRICKHQQTVHLNCSGLSRNSPAKDNWWGLEFYNTTIYKSINDFVIINESSSILENVDVLFAGVTKEGYPVPAIRASPSVPSLVNVRILHCALDATNFTEVLSSTIVYNSTVTNNRGHGIVVESHLGRVEIKNSNITSNHGNGVKAKFLNGRFYIFDEYMTFCMMSNLQIQTFPQMISGIPSGGSSCGRMFENKFGYRVTMNVLEMDIEPQAVGTLDVYDGRDKTWPKIASYKIMNGTHPMGITSTFNSMFVEFSWRRPPRGGCPTLLDCVKFTILIDSTVESMPEFFMNNTVVTGNLQHGLYLENTRNYIIVNASTVTHNGYGAGIRIYGGASDVLVNASIVDYNQDNGVNITYDGGWRIFNRSSFSYNFGNGINITMNETRVDNKTVYARHQKTEVSRSYFLNNEGHGIRVGNYCQAGIAVVNDSSFVGNRKAAVEFESCFRIVPEQNVTNFTIGYNEFRENLEHAIKISPLLNAVGRIANNTFVDHPRYVLLLDNTDDFLHSKFYQNMKVSYEVLGNVFQNNRGFYVANLRLTQGSQQQKLDFKFNVFTENVIEGTVPTLNQRTRAYAVVILSSSNVNFNRNHLVNVNSRFEIATHLLDMSINLQATQQWWGTTNYSLILPKIFDQFSRYNLAKVLYHPALAYDWLYTPVLTDRNTEIEIEFLRGDTIGGRLATELRTTPGMTYYVDRDISILGYGKLYVSPGTVFEFQNAIGMLIQGYVDFSGSGDKPITMLLMNETTWVNSSLIRLTGGPSLLEGRLEVRPTEADEWGTVCNEGWTMADSSVACQQMGFVVHPEVWKMYVTQPGSTSQPIWRSNVQCTSLDMDLLFCAGDDRNDHSCTHDQDVYVRCKEPTWAGVRFLATARSSRMSYVAVTGAGLMDPATAVYAPAIKIDYNVHMMENLNISGNMADGLQVMHNDVYSNAKLIGSLVENNLGNGVTVRGSFFELFNCTLRGNGKAGFEYNPAYSTYEALQIRAGVHDFVSFDKSLNIVLGDHEVKWFLTPQRFTPEGTTYDLEISVNQYQRVVMDVIDYNPDMTQEKVTVFDSRLSAIRDGTKNWMIDEDIVDFPIVSQLTHITVRWRVPGTSSGRFTFVVRARPWSWVFPFPTLMIKNSTTTGNHHGVITRHYNQPSNEFLDLFHRFRWETIRIFGTTFQGNLYEALHVPSITKYHELYMPTFDELQRALKIAEISYEIESCYFTQNGGGVYAEHNHVEFSNNVWIWQVLNNRFEENRAGGFMIELPKVNMMYTELYNHSVDINDTYFINNENFAFRIDGFYCNSTIARNRFQGNLCKVGCITIAGTEKDFDFHDNEIVENTGKYMLEINMNSHTPFTQWVQASVSYNNIKRNVKPFVAKDPTATSMPTTYAFGVLGLQNVTLRRNLFSNGMDFEMLGGQSSALLENYLDVTENWWGTVDQAKIKDRIFDFDDWNSYAIAEYFPFLVSDGFNSPVFIGEKFRPILDLSKPLGGRITENLNLKRRAEPYIVKSDLTVMQDVSLIIEEGAELQFYPSVGILVLGSLVAQGTPESRVKFSPILKTQYVKNRGRRSTNVPGDKILHPDINSRLGYQVRLTGGENEDEGFIEIYNNTEHRWSIICDNNFNERTAEVACRTMGRESSNAWVRINHYYDIFVYGYPKMHEQVIEWFWRESLICDGSEEALEQCRYKVNYNLYQCMEKRDYVFVRCGPRNLPPEYDYWGSIRFSAPNYESMFITPGYSSLSYVDIYGAGILHSEKSGAVQAIYRSPESDNVCVQNCASNGYDYIAPVSKFNILHNVIQNNNGYAIGTLVLNGQSSEQRESQFTPLVVSGVPYNVYSMLRMCTTEKLVYIRDRALLYHKYTFDTIDCIKVLRSKEPHKQIAVRFLQVNIYNDSFYKNAIEMYNGEFFDYQLLIAELTANSTLNQHKLQYMTSQHYDTMGIRVTGSAAYGDFGFIAEVVTLPLSPQGRPDHGSTLMQRIANSLLSNNLAGGFFFRNVGEKNPRVTFEQNKVERCGVKILNNTSPGVIDLFIQNTRMLTISNNYISHNAGGITVNTTTKDNDVAIYANITNNVVMYNTHGVPLHLEGHHYQGFDLRYNYFAYNDVEYRNVLAAFGIQLNFSTNIVFHNTGQCILNASVLEKISINQRYVRNAFYDNYAFAYNRSTIFLKSAKFEFSYNYLLNPYNVYEMVTFNRTKYPDGSYPSVEARHNWWGRNHPSYVAGRIWERRDDDNLIRVDYEPFVTDNKTVLEGKCYPGWRQFENKCYWYFGGVVAYAEAEVLCKCYVFQSTSYQTKMTGILYHGAYTENTEHTLGSSPKPYRLGLMYSVYCRHWGRLSKATYGRLAWARDPQHRERNLGELVSQFQFNYDVNWMTWIFSDWQKEDQCTVLRDYRVEHTNCNKMLPFICERDPYIMPQMNTLPIIITTVIAGSVIVFVIIPLLIFACIKSIQRKEEKVERREALQRSLHASKASLCSIQSPLGPPEEVKKRRPPLRIDTGYMDITGATVDDSNSDSIEKGKFDFHRPSTPASTVDFYSSKWDTTSYGDSDLTPYKRPSLNLMYPARVENEINTMAGRPLLGSPYGNGTFDEYSVNASTMGSVAAAEIEPLQPVGPRRGSRPRLNYLSEASYRSGDESDYKETKVRPPRPKPKTRDTNV